MLDVQVRFPTPFLGTARAVLRPGSATSRRMYRAMATVYLQAMRTRFDRFSEGGGNWPPLSRRTLEARARRPVARRLGYLVSIGIEGALAAGDPGLQRARSKARRAIAKIRAERRAGVLGAANATILRDTGTLFRGLAAMMVVDTPRGVSFGFQGMAARGKLTLARLAAIHQRGVPGRIPARPILVKPDVQTSARMRAVATDIIVRAVHAAGGRGRR